MKQDKEKIESNIRFEKNKTSEKCLTESAMLNRPCNCPEGEILSRIDWTQKVTPTPTISAGIQNIWGTINMI